MMTHVLYNNGVS